MVRKLASDGRQQLRIGTRTHNRVFKFNRSWSIDDVDRVKRQLQDVFDFWECWNATSNAVADNLKKGVNPVPIPEPILDDMPETVLRDVLQRQRIQIPALNEHGFSIGRVPLPEIDLPFWESILRRHLPSINWASLGQSIPVELLERLRSEQLETLQQSADVVASIDTRPKSKATAVKGTLQDALKKYDEYVKNDQPANLDRHSKIKQLINRHSDIPLASLDIEQCRILIDYWRLRPMRHDKKGQYSEKRSTEQLAELDNFFEHTHLSTDFAWRMPDDLQLLKRTVSKDEKKSLTYISIPLFSVNELKQLMNSGDTIQRLIVTWCLNCAHGAAEIGRITWGDIYLNQYHPWKSQGLKIESGGNWTGFFRHKTKVAGWWSLWPETVELIKEWKPQAEQLLKREIIDTDRLILTQDGLSMYKDESKNAQSKFAKVFNDIRTLAKVSDLPFGTLRNQLPDWLSTTQGDAVAASVALAHGIPHKGDKLLFAHYSNRPWSNLFEHQRQFREVYFQ